MSATRRGLGSLVPSGWLWVAALAVGASIVRALSDGQDLNFDFVTYHYYLGHTAFADRTALDFLPASFQGYQSPLPYALLVWLDEHGVPPWINASLHASVHALGLVVLLLVSRLLIGVVSGREGRVKLVALWLLGAVAPVYWNLVGTSFADLPTSVLVLGALWLVAAGVELRPDDPVPVPLLAGGAWLAGLAVGMRWHNAIYAVALACALGTAHFDRLRERFRATGIFVVAATLGWAVGFLPWGLRVAHEFGNPVFPLFNGWFRSPDFFAQNLPLTGFKPDGLADWLMFPFRIASFADWVYVETRLPDVRPALLVITGLALAVVTSCRVAAGRASIPADAAPARRLILVFFAVSLVLWLATSCNGRYGVALLLLAGPVCGELLLRLLRVRHMVLITAAVLLWQAALQQASFALPRWTSGPWTAGYFDWDLPDWMAREPAIFLSFGYQTASTVAPKLHPLSRHVNLVGQYSIPPDGPGSARVERMLDTSSSRIFGIFDFYYTQQSDPGTRSIKDYFREHLSLWGLEFTPALCTQLALRAPAAQGYWLNLWLGIRYRGARPEYIVCELKKSEPSVRAAALGRLRDFRARLASLSAACPGYFGVPVSLERHPGQWLVTSFGSLEFRIEFYDDGLMALQQTRPPYAEIVLGRQTDPRVPPGGSDCSRWPAMLAQAAQAASP